MGLFFSLFDRKSSIKECFDYAKKEPYESGLTFQGFFGMSRKEKAAYEREHPFPYRTVKEYAEDVVEWLCLSSWHYTEEEAREIVKNRKAWIRECFESGAPVDIAGAEAGYACG